MRSRAIFCVHKRLLCVRWQENWIGGWVTKEGREFTGFDGLRERLKTDFELVKEEDWPMVYRETERQFHWQVSHVTVWRRR